MFNMQLKPLWFQGKKLGAPFLNHAAQNCMVFGLSQEKCSVSVAPMDKHHCIMGNVGIKNEDFTAHEKHC